MDSIQPATPGRAAVSSGADTGGPPTVAGPPDVVRLESQGVSHPKLDTRAALQTTGATAALHKARVASVTMDGGAGAVPRPDTGELVKTLALNPSNIPPFPSTRVTFVYDDGGRPQVTNPGVVGSWDLKGMYSQNWTTPAIPMQKDKDGLWRATVDLQNDAQHDWQWGLIADLPGRPKQWMITTEGNRHLTLTAPAQTEEFAPTTYNRMGAYQSGSNLAFKFWAPDATDVQVKLMPPGRDPSLVPMTMDPKTGMWMAAVPGGFAALQGTPYVYQVKTPEGATNEISDPYARDFQGPQRGLSPVYLDSATGQETQKYLNDAQQELLRVEVQGHGDASAAWLTLSDDSGHALTKNELLSRLGAGSSDLVRKFHGGAFSDLWSDNVSDDGRISLVKQGTAWATLVNNLSAIDGLHYQLQLDGGRPGPNAINDPYDNKIHIATLGSPRASVVSNPAFEWKHDSVPRETDARKFVIYQAHVGSIFGAAGNVQRSTFQDLTNHLDYLKKLGVNTIELLPTNEMEGLRDWGYIGTSRFAQAQNYGYEDASGQWVSGTEALKRFVDAAHERGLNVMNDVVYNHFGGDYNDLEHMDGQADPWFNWKDGKIVTGPDGKPTVNSQYVNTPWGEMAAWDKDAVRQFVVDDADAQAEELHFDGMRFDFVQPIQSSGSDGWNMLRQINRTIKLYKPAELTVAEEFPYDTSLTDPIKTDGTGAGFNAEWNTEFQHRLVHDNDTPSIIQAAARGQQTNMDRFMDEIVNHPFFTSPADEISIISDHDEVGNGERTIAAASGDQTSQVPSAWACAASRFAFGMGMMSPGIPMFFQGEESLASNPFKWGISSTWDTGWSWLNAPSTTATPASPSNDVDALRRAHFAFCQDAIALHTSSSAFVADAPVARVYTHNDNSVLAFTRGSDSEQYLIVGSLNHNKQAGYNIPIPPGKWQLVLDSDDVKYGGSTSGALGTTVDGGPAARFDLPAGGMLVYKKVE